MKNTQGCDYTRPGVEPWWACCSGANAVEPDAGHPHAA
jgi:hypothetical protein